MGAGRFPGIGAWLGWTWVLGTALMGGSGGLSSETVVVQGIAVEFSVRPLSADGVKAGVDVEVRFRITDTASDAPVTGLRPTAWMDLRPSEAPTDAAACKAKVQAFLRETFRARPTVDLNAYYVLTLNDDATVSVIDPLRGFGGSRLLALIALPGPGEDWALSPDRRWLYVAVPTVRQVAVVDTTTWRVVAAVEACDRPGRLGLQPDGHFLWVGCDEGGVAVIDTEARQVVVRVSTTPGPHEFAFADDGAVFVVSEGGDVLTVLDATRPEVARRVSVGPGPVGVAYSRLSRDVYVTHRGGILSVVDPVQGVVRTRLRFSPGLGPVAVTPDGRWVLVLHGRRDVVYAIDAATNRLVHALRVGRSPYQIAWTPTHAYVRCRDTELVYVFSLRDLGASRSVPVRYFPAGQYPLRLGTRPSRAPTMAQTPEPNAILIASPADRLVAYYMEGMPAPMEGYANYGREPRAVQVVDRSLRETSPGLYSTVVRPPVGGTYDVLFRLDAPPLVHCFSLTVAPDPQVLRRGGTAPQVLVEALTGRVPVGTDVPFRFRVLEAETRKPRDGLRLWVLVAHPGGWQWRAEARPVGEGLYEADLRFPEEGVYYVFFACPGLGWTFRDMPVLIVPTLGVEAPGRP